MGKISRRSMIRGTAGLAAASALARPYIANAAATTAAVWWTQGFIPEEDASFRTMVADYEKESGDKINYSILPFVALGQKMISALQTNDTPDVMSYDGNQMTMVLNAWHDKLVDVSDVVATQEAKMAPTPLLGGKLYNQVAKRRSYYGVPYKTACEPFHIWGDLVEKAGYKMSDIPNTWNARWDWFKPMQAKLRSSGYRRMYALGLQMTTNGPSDGNNVFHGHLLANGGQNIVTPDGALHLDDPQVKEAVIRVIEYFTTAYKEGYVPKGAISWNDADDNNGFHSKLFIMDFDGTLSTELAMYHRKKDFDAVVVEGLPLGNDGKPMPAMVGPIAGMIPRAAKNQRVAKEFLKFVIRPEVNNKYLKAGLGRWLPVYPDVVKSDPFWLNNPDKSLGAKLVPYIQQALLGPTIPDYISFTPAYGDVEAQQVWGQSYSYVYKDGMTPKQAAEKAFRQIEATFAKYPIA
jgi:multiple sugar transport system substrate-binding protein